MFLKDFTFALQLVKELFVCHFATPPTKWSQCQERVSKHNNTTFNKTKQKNAPQRAATTRLYKERTTLESAL